MYKLLIVDDEEFEREGMAQFIPWENHGITLVGTAWNGAEGYGKIKEYSPDIVLTDIKMPMMNGIELIQKTKANFPEVEFIVLSGYGEYEFTSQAMAEGVRHYILKPCDEEKVMEALEKVVEDIAKKRRQRQQNEQYSVAIRKLLPRAKEQVFYNLLLGREQIQADYRLFMEELKPEHASVRVLVMRFEQEIDYLGQFVLENILGELLGENTLILETAIAKETVFLLRAVDTKKIEIVVARAKKVFGRVTDKPIYAALSTEGTPGDIRELYLQTDELFRMREKKHSGKLLCRELFRETKDEVDALVNYARIRETADFGEVLFELYLTFCKMELEGYSYRRKKEICRWIQKVLYGACADAAESDGAEDASSDRAGGETSDKAEETASDWKLLQSTALFIDEKKSEGIPKERERRRVDQILLAVYEHLSEPEMNIRFLAREVVFMNEDYFGRLFLRHQKVKFSAYVLELRIHMAQRIMQYRPDIRISEVAAMIGFPADGQYFSKVFRKVAGIPPSEYREKLIAR